MQGGAERGLPLLSVPKNQSVGECQAGLLHRAGWSEASEQGAVLSEQCRNYYHSCVSRGSHRALFPWGLNRGPA